jgi:hypothetical protein
MAPSGEHLFQPGVRGEGVHCLRHRETQFEIGACPVFGSPAAESKATAMSQAGEAIGPVWCANRVRRGGIFRSIHLDENSGFYWILQVHCKAD